MRTFGTAVIAVGGGLIIGIALAPPGTRAAADDGLQRLLDEAAIEDVLVRYTHALDTLDADKYASVFAEDAIFDRRRR